MKEYLKQLFYGHYNNTKFVRTGKQLEDERWVFCGTVPFRRVMTLPAAVAIQLCSGSMYAWSGYNIPIETAIYGPNMVDGVLVDRNIASITYFIVFSIFGLSAAFMGPWIERNGPRKGATLGAILFFAGNIVTAIGIYAQTVALVYLGYGILGGFGLGLCYISPVSAIQKWFPDKRGLTAGLAVAGFGAGSIIAAYAQNALIASYSVSSTFLIVGVYYFLFQISGAYFLRYPPPGYSVDNVYLDTFRGAENQNITVINALNSKSSINGTKGASDDLSMAATAAVVTTTASAVSYNALNHDNNGIIDESGSPTQVYDVNVLLKISLLKALNSCEFRAMYVMFFGNALAGLLIASKIQSFVTNQFRQDSNQAVLANALLGMFNLLGRLLLPLLSDYIKMRKPIFILTTSIQVCALLSLSTSIHTQNYNNFLAAVFAIIFCYGGGYGVIPAFLSDQFSASNSSGTHGVILTVSSLVSVIGALVFTSILNQQQAYWMRVNPSQGLLYIYDVNFIWITAIMALSLANTAVLLATDLKERRIPKQPNEIFRTRNLWSGRIVLIFWKSESRMLSFRELTLDEEDRYWRDYLEDLIDKLKQQSDVEQVQAPPATVSADYSSKQEHKNPLQRALLDHQ